MSSSDSLESPFMLLSMIRARERAYAVSRCGKWKKGIDACATFVLIG